MPCFRDTGDQAFQALGQQIIVCQWILIDLECVELVCSSSAPFLKLLIYNVTTCF